MFYTIQELMAQIKGWEYIIAILFLALFLWFWQALVRPPRESRRPQPAGVPPAAPVRPRKEAAPINGAATGAKRTPCWEIRECPPDVKEKCPAFALSPLPCWAARQLVSGKGWGTCDNCPIYLRGIERLVETARGAKTRGSG